MKGYTAVIATVFTVLVLLTGYFFIGGTLFYDVSVETANAGDFPEAFSAIEGIIDGGSAFETYRLTDLGAAEDCTLTSITVRLKNYGAFPCEWLEISMVPAAGDVAAYSVTGYADTVDGFGSGQVNLKLISHGTGPRTVEISYYVFGMHRTIRVPVDA